MRGTAQFMTGGRLDITDRRDLPKEQDIVVCRRERYFGVGILAVEITFLPQYG